MNFLSYYSKLKIPLPCLPGIVILIIGVLGATTTMSAVTVGVNNMSVVHKGSSGITIGFPDVCKIPGPPLVSVPIPYPNIGTRDQNSSTKQKATADKIQPARKTVISKEQLKKLTRLEQLIIWVNDIQMVANAYESKLRRSSAPKLEIQKAKKTLVQVHSLAAQAKKAIDAFSPRDRTLHLRLNAIYKKLLQINYPSLLRTPPARLKTSRLTTTARTTQKSAPLTSRPKIALVSKYKNQIKREPWDQWTKFAWDGFKFSVNNNWLQLAHFQNVTINGPTAICGHNCLAGPEIGPLINNYLSSKQVPTQIRSAFSEALSDAWASWQKSVRIPGLPWYPGFVSFPGPAAPPTPNVPMPLMVLRASSLVELTDANRLSDRIRTGLGERNLPDYAREEIQKFTQTLSAKMNLFMSSAQVMHVMGRGPVPTFAPPYVPVGPVVGGTIIYAPPHIKGSLR